MAEITGWQVELELVVVTTSRPNLLAIACE